MSRVGKKPIDILRGVIIKVEDGEVMVIGPKGSLRLKPRPEIKVIVKDNQVLVTRQREDKFSRSLHGLTRTLIANMVKGVTEGFSKTLKLVGIGYRATMEGNTLVLSLGFSHPIKIIPAEQIKFELEGNDTIRIIGIDKGLVTQWAAKLRALKTPEPYKGKGIRYLNEEVRHKPGKAGKVGAAVGVGGGK